MNPQYLKLCGNETAPCTSASKIASGPIARTSNVALQALAACLFAAVSLTATAQTTPVAEAALELPDAPFAHSSGEDSATSLPQATSQVVATASTYPMASNRDHYIQPGQSVPPLTSHDKVVMGFQGALSLFAATGWVATAGWEQITKTPPVYGTDGEAFAQRLGAAAARATSENLLADCAFAPLFHEDPRYYRLGSRHNFFKRVIYAATRPIITKNDSGKAVPNYSQIVANLLGAALTNAYYPDSDKSFGQTMATWGGGLGGTAFGNGVAELFGGILFKPK
jgi:hypothetical protein